MFKIGDEVITLKVFAINPRIVIGVISIHYFKILNFRYFELWFITDWRWGRTDLDILYVELTVFLQELLVFSKIWSWWYVLWMIFKPYRLWIVYHFEFDFFFLSSRPIGKIIMNQILFISWLHDLRWWLGRLWRQEKLLWGAWVMVEIEVLTWLVETKGLSII